MVGLVLLFLVFGWFLGWIRYFLGFSAEFTPLKVFIFLSVLPNSLEHPKFFANKILLFTMAGVLDPRPMLFALRPITPEPFPIRPGKLPKPIFQIKSILPYIGLPIRPDHFTTATHLAIQPRPSILPSIRPPIRPIPLYLIIEESPLCH